MPNTTPHKATLRRYDGEKWIPVFIATSADITQIGEALTVMGPGHGVYKDGETIPANEAVSTIIKKLIQTQVLPEYVAPTIQIAIETGDQPGTYEVGAHINATLSSIVTLGDAGAIAAHYFAKGTEQIDSSTDATKSYILDMDLTEDLVLTSACEYGQGEIKKDNFNVDCPDGRIEAGTITSEAVLYTVSRNAFYGVDSLGDTTPIATSDGIRALSGSLSSSECEAGNTVEVAVPRGSTRFTIALPESFVGVKRIEYVESGNANVLDQFNLTSLAVEGANHYTGVMYKIYMIAWDQPISGNMTLRVVFGPSEVSDG